MARLGKPEMITSHSLVPSSASYSSILSHLFSLSLFSNLSIKLSGLPLLIDPELTARACAYYDQYKRPYHGTGTGYTAAPQAANEDDTSHEDVSQTGASQSQSRADGDTAWREVKKRVKFYLEPILEAFGDFRIMYSSDFPGWSNILFFRSLHLELLKGAEICFVFASWLAFGSLFDKESGQVNGWQTKYYECQFEIYRECLSELGLENEALDNVFGLNAQLSSFHLFLLFFLCKFLNVKSSASQRILIIILIPRSTCTGGGTVFRAPDSG